MPTIHNRFVMVNTHRIFYRETGNPKSPTLLLLHGFPTSSHMFRRLIPLLADQYHLIAPDFLGFGFSDAPPNSTFKYTFENLAQIVEQFTQVIQLKEYAIYIFDYGAPIGLRLALKHPDQITAIISQNGNAYVEGLSQGWNPIQKYWEEKTPKNRAALKEFLKPESVKQQYLHGVADETLIEPESYTLDSAFLGRPGNDEIQLDLFLDYASNVALYPQFQEYFRKNKPPLLAIWGENDPFFLPKGAESYKRDLPNAQVIFYDTGHFALETHLHEMINPMRSFLSQHSAIKAAR